MLGAIRHIAVRASLKAAVVMAPSGYAFHDSPPPIHDVRGQLYVSADREYGPRKKAPIYVVWHHSATATTATLNSMAKFQVEVRKWAGLSYTYAIDQNGFIYWCNDIMTKTNHAQGYNEVSIGIVLIGNFHEGDVPSEKMKASALKLQEHLRVKLSLQGSWYHGETKATACPGRNAIPFIRSMEYGPRPKRK